MKYEREKRCIGFCLVSIKILFKGSPCFRRQNNFRLDIGIYKYKQIH